MHYDIFGDIHGHADALEILLQKLGYERKQGVYSHPQGRQALFVGDFIDRGPKIRETLHLVKDMCDAGHARAVMGNHEFNAISFHTPHEERGGFFRDHDLPEIEQHIETLQQFQHFPKEWSYFLDWFRTLPLWLDLGVLRLVHACWDPAHIAFLEARFHGFDAAFLRAANDKSDTSGIHAALEETLKGKEFTLPAPHHFFDKGGVRRHECRIKWWNPLHAYSTYKELLFNCPDELADKTVADPTAFYSYTDDVHVFFGHYWLEGTPKGATATCLDYSVARGGKLVACRFDVVEGKVKMDLVW